MPDAPLGLLLVLPYYNPFLLTGSKDTGLGRYPPGRPISYDGNCIPDDSGGLSIG